MIKVKRTPTCGYCAPGIHHMIDTDSYPNDNKAVLTKDGKWKCGNCVENELDDIFLSTAPYSDPKRYQEIMDKRRREEDKRRKVAEIKALVERANNSNNKKPAGRLVR